MRREDRQIAGMRWVATARNVRHTFCTRVLLRHNRGARDAPIVENDSFPARGDAVQCKRRRDFEQIFLRVTRLSNLESADAVEYENQVRKAEQTGKGR